MNVYEVEIETGIEGFRLLHHIRAVDEAAASAKVQVLHGAEAKLLPDVVFKRACTVKETADEEAKEAAAVNP